MSKEVEKQLEAIKNKILEAVPHIVANTAVDYFKDTFRKKAFDGKPWPGFAPTYKHRSNGSLMIDTSALMNSIRPGVISRKLVEICAGNNKVPYAKPHNEGFVGSVVIPAHQRTSKKGKTYEVKSYTRRMHLPQRQFLGNSNELTELLNKRIKGFINSIKK